jgi:hypothetical protein
MNTARKYDEIGESSSDNNDEDDDEVEVEVDEVEVDEVEVEVEVEEPFFENLEEELKDRRLWQQVLEEERGTTSALHDLAILAENAEPKELEEAPHFFGPLQVPQPLPLTLPLPLTSPYNSTRKTTAILPSPTKASPSSSPQERKQKPSSSQANSRSSSYTSSTTTTNTSNSSKSSNKRRRLQPVPPSAARIQWNRVVAERTVARQALSDAQREVAKAQATLEATKAQAQQAEEAAQTTCHEWHVTLIQEDDPPHPSNTTSSWYEGYEWWMAYKAQHDGDTRVPRNPSSGAAKHNEQQPEPQPHPDAQQQQQQLKKLSRWVGENRRLHRKQELDEYKVYALQQIGFDWDPCQTKWMHKYQQLAEFVKQHGHARVPYNSNVSKKKKKKKNSTTTATNKNTAADTNNNNDDDGGLLGAWVKRQQYQYKLFQERDDDGRRRRPTEMTAERIQLLNGLGMVWKRRSDSWMQRYRELQSFFQKHGHVHVTANDDDSLFEWVRDQRTQLKKYLLLLLVLQEEEGRPPPPPLHQDNEDDGNNNNNRQQQQQQQYSIRLDLDQTTSGLVARHWIGIGCPRQQMANTNRRVASIPKSPWTCDCAQQVPPQSSLVELVWYSTTALSTLDDDDDDQTQ